MICLVNIYWSYKYPHRGVLCNVSILFYSLRHMELGKGSRLQYVAIHLYNQHRFPRYTFKKFVCIVCNLTLLLFLNLINHTFCFGVRVLFFIQIIHLWRSKFKLVGLHVSIILSFHHFMVFIQHLSCNFIILIDHLEGRDLACYILRLVW